MLTGIQTKDLHYEVPLHLVRESFWQISQLRLSTKFSTGVEKEWCISHTPVGCVLNLSTLH